MKMQRYTSSEDKFFKNPRFYGLVHLNRIDQPRQLEQSQFTLKYLKLILVTLLLITQNGTK